MHLGDVELATLYTNEVSRKVAQECKDMEIGVDPKDGNNPVLILQKLKHRARYAGTIEKISLEPFILIYILPEQIFLFKEYSRLFQNDVSVCIDSTASLVIPLEVDENVKSPNIFLFERVINLFNVTVPVGQMLSSTQDANTILYFLNVWLIKVGIIPKKSVSDYSRALLAATCLLFNCVSLKDYIRDCFSALQDKTNIDRPFPTMVRIDVAHLIAIFCRLKCFTPGKKPVNDFFIRCVALLVWCDDFKRFEGILLLTLTVSIHQFDGNIHGSTLPSPAEAARLQFLHYIANEKNRAIKLIPDESTKGFKRTIEKLSSTEIDVENANCFLNVEPDSVDVTVSEWLANLKTKAEEGKDTENERVNAYYLPQFYQHLLRLAPEYVIWSEVMIEFLKSKQVRATSCFVEGDFGELKNGVLRGVYRSVRADKLCRIHFEALKGQVVISSAAITSFIMDQPSTMYLHAAGNVNEETPNNVTVFPKVPISWSSLIEKTECSAADPFSTSGANVEYPANPDLYERENWRNKGEKEDVILAGYMIFSNLDSQHQNLKKACLTDHSYSLIITEPNFLVAEKDFNAPIEVRTKGRKYSKRTLQPAERKPSKFFKACPAIKIQQNAAVVSHCRFSGRSPMEED